VRGFIAVLTLQRPGLDPQPDYFGFVVEKAALKQVSLQVLRFPCQYNSTTTQYLYFSHLLPILYNLSSWQCCY